MYLASLEHPQAEVSKQGVIIKLKYCNFFLLADKDMTKLRQFGIVLL